MKRHLVLALIVGLLGVMPACGDGGTEPPPPPPPEVLNTATHGEANGSWPDFSVVSTNIAWRFLSLGAGGVRGSYNFTLLNTDVTPTLATYETRFFDSSGFEIDRYTPLAASTVLQPGSPRDISDNFTLGSVTSVGMANAISEMQVWASFLVSDLAITTASLPAGTVGRHYSAAIDVSGGGSSLFYEWSISSGSLPTGLRLSGLFGITGSPASAGTSTFTVQVISGWQTATRDFSITIR